MILLSLGRKEDFLLIRREASFVATLMLTAPSFFPLRSIVYVVQGRLKLCSDVRDSTRRLVALRVIMLLGEARCEIVDP